MHLDEFEKFSSLDNQNMYGEILSLPDQLEYAWNYGKNISLPGWSGIEKILVSGMGGSAIGGDMLIEYVKDQCRVPIILHRDYDLPGWAQGENTLVIACSHSGTTEETISSFQMARNKGCLGAVISTGGTLVELAQAAGLPALVFNHKGQPRAAIGYSFGLLLSFLFRLGMIDDQSSKVAEAVNIMRENSRKYLADVPLVHNPAKRLAAQLVDRDITVMGAGFLNVIARRWKCQINELAKCWAGFEYLPEADHNTVAGLYNPEEMIYKRFILFLRSSLLHPRNQLRSRITMEKYLVEGFITDFYDAEGGTVLSHMWTTLQLGDFVSFYLALLFDMDPTPIPTIQDLKQALKNG